MLSLFQLHPTLSWAATSEEIQNCHELGAKTPLNERTMDIESLIPNPHIDYRCDNKRFCLSAHDCQVPTPTFQNIEAEQQIRIF